ncbi:hypothetical protein [Pseudonocardia sp. GCM10023141]|uniref:hypothetical protein n=1 Tax=Pseudonocardia sp. GCM10023141 TaxID=3252653 RepID=UPI0036154F30
MLSPKENPGFLPGLNAGAFNLGAGLSFVVIYAVAAATPGGGYYGGVLAGLVVLAVALGASLLIPRPHDAEAIAPAPGTA